MRGPPEELGGNLLDLIGCLMGWEHFVAAFSVSASS
jgi:hypothetical protein